MSTAHLPVMRPPFTSASTWAEAGHVLGVVLLAGVGGVQGGPLLCPVPDAASDLKAHPTATRLNVTGSNHRPDGKDSRPQVHYEVTPRPGSYALDEFQHRWTGCKCGADWLISAEKLEVAYLRALTVGRPEVVFGVDVL